jgi:hypothetical protein
MSLWASGQLQWCKHETQRKNVKLCHEIVQRATGQISFILGGGKWLASGFGHFIPNDDIMKGSGSSNITRNRDPTRYQTVSLSGFKLCPYLVSNFVPTWYQTVSLPGIKLCPYLVSNCSSLTFNNCLSVHKFTDKGKIIAQRILLFNVHKGLSTKPFKKISSSIVCFSPSALANQWA